MFRRWILIYLVWVEAGEKRKESFNSVTLVLDTRDPRSIKHPRRGPDPHRLSVSTLSLLLLGTTGYIISLCLFTRRGRG